MKNPNKQFILITSILLVCLFPLFAMGQTQNDSKSEEKLVLIEFDVGNNKSHTFPITLVQCNGGSYACVSTTIIEGHKNSKARVGITDLNSKESVDVTTSLAIDLERPLYSNVLLTIYSAAVSQPNLKEYQILLSDKSRDNFTAGELEFAAILPRSGSLYYSKMKYKAKSVVAADEMIVTSDLSDIIQFIDIRVPDPFPTGVLGSPAFLASAAEGATFIGVVALEPTAAGDVRTVVVPSKWIVDWIARSVK